MPVHIESGGVPCNILPSACVCLSPPPLLFSCIYEPFFFLPPPRREATIPFTLVFAARLLFFLPFAKKQRSQMSNFIDFPMKFDIVVAQQQ